MGDDSRWWDGTRVAEEIATGEVSAIEVLEAAIERTEEAEPQLNAIAMRWFDHAREVAGYELPGPFGGVPFLLKDLWVQYAGQGRTDGNAALAESPPISTVDSVLTQRFKAAGLVTFGRTTSSEMGSIPVTETLAHGDTRNPWDLDRTPGGSSGGAAAAVASGYVPMAHASDGGGSIRIPASCCGLVGLKPSQGRISMQGHGIENGLGVDGFVTRSVRDTARLLDAVHGPGVGDTVIAPGPSQPYAAELNGAVAPLKIGLLDTAPLGGPLDDECITAVRNTASALESLGHHVDVSHPASMNNTDLTDRFLAMWFAGRGQGLANMGRAIGRELTEADVEPHNWIMAEQAKAMSAADYSDALAAVAQYRRETQQWWADGFDLLLTPTLAALPPAIGELTSSADDPMGGVMKAIGLCPFTPPFNTTGQPAISLPLHWSESGLPVGVQLVSAYGRDDLLISIAAQLEQVLPWSDRHPEMAS